MAETFHFSEIAEAADAVREHIFANSGKFPEAIRDRVVALARTSATPSPVDMVVGFTRAVYANRGDLDTETKRMAIATSELIQEKGYHGRLDDKAGGISAALSRETGLKPATGRSWPSKDDDPAPDTEWGPPAPEEAEEAPADGNEQ